MSKVVVLDNGANEIRAGFAGEANERVKIPNSCGRLKRQHRLLVADGISNVQNTSHLYQFRPIDRGILVDAQAEALIWDRVFGPAHLDLSSPRENSLLVSSQPYLPRWSSKAYEELAFETFGFAAFARVPSQVMAAHSFLSKEFDSQKSIRTGDLLGSAAESSSIFSSWCGGGFGGKRRGGKSSLAVDFSTLAPNVSRENCGLSFSSTGSGIIVDLGHSCTNIMPFSSFFPIGKGVKRVDIGGKALTNALAESLSFRQFNVMEDPILVSRIKQELCYVSLDFISEMAIAEKMKNQTALQKSKQKRDQVEARLSSSASSSSSSFSALPVPICIDERLSEGYRLCCELSKSHAISTPHFQSLQNHEISDQNTNTINYGTQRDYVLPDYAGIPHGYVRGGPHDPSNVKKDAKDTGSMEGLEEDESNQRQSSSSSSSSSTFIPSIGAKRPRNADTPRISRMGVASATALDLVGNNDDDSQVLTLLTERFSIPEILFNPSDIGMNQCGIAEAIAEAIQECPKEIRPIMWSSIILVGGGALLPGLEARLYSELTSLCPTEYSGLVGIYTPKDPLGSTWKGGSIMGSRHDMFSSSFSQSVTKSSSVLSITKTDYFEKGSLYLDLENRFTL